jgi:hypothetical protein
VIAKQTRVLSSVVCKNKAGAFAERRVASMPKLASVIFQASDFMSMLDVSLPHEQPQIGLT